MKECSAMPLIDEAVLRSLGSAVGAPMFRELIADCLGDVRQATARLEGALKNSDGSGVKRAAHTLSGVLGQFGCPRAACMARALEDSDDEIALATARPTLAVVLESVENLKAWASID